MNLYSLNFNLLFYKNNKRNYSKQEQQQINQCSESLTHTRQHPPIDNLRPASAITPYFYNFPLFGYCKATRRTNHPEMIMLIQCFFFLLLLQCCFLQKKRKLKESPSNFHSAVPCCLRERTKNLMKDIFLIKVNHLLLPALILLPK